MDDKLIKNFDKWNNENHRNRIENDGCAVWTVILTDLPRFEGKQPRVSVVFSRYQGNNTDKTILMGDNNHSIGMVLAIPSYWLDVDHYLCTNYISNYIDEYIETYFGDGSGDGSGSGSGGGCPICPDNCPSNPPPPPPRPRPFPPPPPPSTPPNAPPVFNDHISPVGPPLMSPPRPDPSINEFNKQP